MDNNTTSYYKFSNFLPRFLALIVDGILVLTVGFILKQLNFGKSLTVDLITVLTSMIYPVVFIYLYGATLGKMLLRIRVVNVNYQKLTFIQVLKREILGKLISGQLMSLGYIWAAIDDKKQTWHDKIAKTYVIYSQPIAYSEYLELQKNKRSNFPLVLITAGILEVIFPLTAVLFIVPKLSSLYSQSTITGDNPTTIIYGLFGLIMIISISQIVYGMMLGNMQRNIGELSNSQKNIAKVLFLIGIVMAWLAVPIMILAVILPIYRLTTSFQ